MKRITLLAGAALALGALAGSAQAAPPGNSDPVAVCHATGSASNPYVLINPSGRGAAKGHAKDAQSPWTGPSRAATPHHSGGCGGSGGDGGPGYDF